MKRGINISLSILLIFVIVTTLSSASTLSTPSSCCQKTTSGAFCINTDASQCDSAFSIVPTSCESTSYCKLGTCYNSKEGICMENVPQTVCQQGNGTWSEKSPSELPQCTLGCCILGDQAAFVTLARCKSFSTFYGLTNDFRAGVTSETACIALANSQDEGACVKNEGDIKTCTFTTRGQCGGTNSVLALNTSSDETGGTRFYKDVLCSAEELGTVNARQTTTGCYQGKVYWYDSEGQRENVYSSDKDTSWNGGRVATPDQVCGKVGASRNCGNCDYLLGGVCAQWSGVLGLGKPTYGNYFCKATTCTDREGNERKNGESWCVYDAEVGNGRDPAGSRHYREICVDGEIKVEACEDFRNQICVHSGIDTSEGEFSVAACRVNRWQDCTSQTSKDNCENTDQRDCMWVAAVDGINFSAPATSSNSSTAFTNPTASSSSSSSTNTQTAIQGISTLSTTAGAFSNSGSTTTGQAIAPITGYAINYHVGAGVGPWEQNSLNNNLRTNRTSNDTGLCVPVVSPGLDFWSSSGTATSVCSQATAECDIRVTKTEKYSSVITGALGGKKITYEIASEDKNKTCLKMVDASKGTFEVNPQWATQANAVCSSLGDCGADYNLNGVFTDEGYEWRYGNQSYYFTNADLGLLSGASLGQGTGEVVAVDYVINNKYKLGQDDYVYVKQ
ncbi:Uncharacterised protein [uncultured archaeon]|nr:Uncharacterised protein [uncultured archaeon]